MSNKRVTPESFDHLAIRGQVIRLNRMPLEIPPDATACYVGRSSSGRAVLLCPVSKLHNIPKSFAGRVQAVSELWEPTGEQLVLVHRSGRIYAVMNNQPTAY